MSEDDGGAQSRRERLRERGVAREVSAEEFAEMTADAEPRTVDDRPWKFPVRIRMGRSGR